MPKRASKLAMDEESTEAPAYHEKRRDDPIHHNAKSQLDPYLTVCKDMM